MLKKIIATTLDSITIISSEEAKATLEEKKVKKEAQNDDEIKPDSSN